MPGLPLQNLRWEKFCQSYVRGPIAGNATACYVAAGFAGEGSQTARSGAHRLLHKDVVQARIAELQADLVCAEERAATTAFERLCLDKEVVLSGIAQLGFANILDYLRRSETGDIVIDLGAVERARAAGIVEVVSTEHGEGPDRKRSMRVKLCDRHAPLVTLGRHFGLFADNRISEADALKNLSEEELMRRCDEIDAELGLPPTQWPGRPARVPAGDARPAAAAADTTPDATVAADATPPEVSET
jgi:terminase small subunit-like protein